jgi:hypothetical protein
MNPPFSAEAFFGVFAAYNTAVWPLQAVLLGLAIVVLALAMVNTPRRSRAVSATLALLWLWMAIAYHWVFFAQINSAARVFAALFAVQAVLLLWFGFRPDGLRYAPRIDANGWAGGLLVAYALVLYPVIGLATGERFPSLPTFGLPCPTTIFTVGMLLWVRPRAPSVLFLVPAMWAVIGLSGAFAFGVVADYMLPVSLLIVGALALSRKRRSSALKARLRADSRIGGPRSAHA